MKSGLTLTGATREVGLAIRNPESLVQRWRDAEGRSFDLLIGVLLANAIFGTATYGVTMQLHNGAMAMLQSGFLTALAAGLAWVIALPSLYIINSVLGSQLGLRASLLAASVTVCFGAWAMLASVPINWFFSLALPYQSTRWLVNVTIFTGVGICMTDVFLRALRTLDGNRRQTFGQLWICLLGIIGIELFTLFGVF